MQINRNAQKEFTRPEGSLDFRGYLLALEFLAMRDHQSSAGPDLGPLSKRATMHNEERFSLGGAAPRPVRGGLCCWKLRR